MMREKLQSAWRASLECLRAFMRAVRNSALAVVSLFRGRQGKAIGLVLMMAIVLFVTADAALDFAQTLKVRNELQNALDTTVLLAASEPVDTRKSSAGNLFATLTASLSDCAPSAKFLTARDGNLAGFATASVRASLFTYLAFSGLNAASQSTVTSYAPQRPDLFGFFAASRLTVSVEAVAKPSAGGSLLVQ